MKKLLITLSAIFLSISTMATAITPSLTPSNQTQGSRPQTNMIRLALPGVTQVGADYCVAAAFISIFTFLGWQQDRTQSQIYQEARTASGTQPWESGIVPNHNLATYMNDFIRHTTNKEARYAYSTLGVTFGISIDDIAVFSTYVWSSLAVNIPVLMGIHPRLGLGHAMVICGFEENADNIWYDKYTFMDPTNGKFYSILAKDIHQDFKFGIDLFGRGNLAGIKPKVEIEVTPFAEDIRDISGNTGSIYAGEIWINITKHTGISDFSYFHTAFSGVEAPDFKSEIKKVNDDPDVKNLVGFKQAYCQK